MFATRVLSNTPLRQVEGGYLIDIRLPWYRALPVSTVSITALSVDGAEVDLATVQFRLEDLEVFTSELKTYTSRWWHVLDSAFVFVPGKLAFDEPHRVAITVGIRPPYIPGFYRLTECEKILPVEAA